MQSPIQGCELCPVMQSKSTTDPHEQTHYTYADQTPNKDVQNFHQSFTSLSFSQSKQVISGMSPFCKHFPNLKMHHQHLDFPRMERLRS